MVSQLLYIGIKLYISYTGLRNIYLTIAKEEFDNSN